MLLGSGKGGKRFVVSSRMQVILSLTRFHLSFLAFSAAYC
jgi:hypothetical protein